MLGIPEQGVGSAQSPAKTADEKIDSFTSSFGEPQPEQLISFFRLLERTKISEFPERSKHVNS